MKKTSMYILSLAVLLTSTAPLIALEETTASSPSVISEPRPACMKFTDPIRYKDNDTSKQTTHVRDLQNVLFEKGYLTTKPTGYFGALTLQAVKQYQKANGISQTGFVGEKTRGVLRSHVCGGTDEIGAPNSCKVYFDGCNTCTRSEVGAPMACTKMACLTAKQPPYCKEYFDQNPPISQIPDSCKVWYDGCNTCSRATVGGEMACTMMACITLYDPNNKPYCKESFSATPLIKACPSEKIVNQQPVMCIKAPCPMMDNSYYIYQNKRYEIKDFDATYVSQNCKVTESVVY